MKSYWCHHRARVITETRDYAQWRGNSAVVRTPEEALRAIGASGRDFT